MDKIKIADLTIDALSKQDLLNLILQKIQTRQQIWLTTVYSEFLYAGLCDPKIMELLNQADMAVADGIGIFWAKRFLDLPLTAKTYLGKILEALWQAGYSLLAIIFHKKWILSALPEKIPGAELVWDLAKLASDNNFSIYLLGGFGDTPELVSKKLTTYNLQLKTYTSNKHPSDTTIINDINQASPDILLLAFGPIKQEQWILENRNKFPSVKLLVGLGGTFDYLAGRRLSPPDWMRRVGLEWLFRLITQPHRIKRIYNATLGLANLLIHYKVFTSLPLRPNVAIIILNAKNQVLLCQRHVKNHEVDVISTKKALTDKNYWQLPQGGIDADEDLLTSAKREAKEETSLINLQKLYISPHTHTYVWNNALRNFKKNNRHKNRGQIQNLVYLKHLGPDSEVQIDNHEFSNYQWTDINALDKTIHPERKTLTAIVLNDLKEMQEKGII
jgi:N-acetylglucosaminyldiphosphoundecaprenol N-acetyl-beta-D-mannosaminyltransferase